MSQSHISLYVSSKAKHASSELSSSQKALLVMEEIHEKEEDDFEGVENHNDNFD